MKIRKNLLSVIVFVAVAVLFMPIQKAYAVAVVHIDEGVVQGVVTGSDNSPVVGAGVSVTCNNVTNTTSTDGSGHYHVEFENGTCQVGYAVTVDASKDSQSGSNSGYMQWQEANEGSVTINVVLAGSPDVPEFGVITGAFAALTSGGLFLLKRRA